MNFDQFVSEYIAEDHDVEQLSVMVLEGCRAWYPLAAEAEKQKLQEVMEKSGPCGGRCPPVWQVRIFPV